MKKSYFKQMKELKAQKAIMILKPSLTKTTKSISSQAIKVKKILIII